MHTCIIVYRWCLTGPKGCNSCVYDYSGDHIDALCSLFQGWRSEMCYRMGKLPTADDLQPLARGINAVIEGSERN